MTGEELSRAEFLARFPNRELCVHTASGVQVVPFGDEIACDFCNADPGDRLVLIENGRKAICGECAKGILKYQIREG